MTAVLHRLKFLIVLGLMLADPTLRAETADANQLKVAYLYRFAFFTDWPTPPSDTFRICVLGANPFGEVLNLLKHKPIYSATTAVTVLSNSDDAETCHVLYLNPANHEQMEIWLERLAGLPILTVSDKPDAFEDGVLIALQTEPNHIAFRINLAKARKVGLMFRAQLLELAEEVR